MPELQVNVGSKWQLQLDICVPQKPLLLLVTVKGVQPLPLLTNSNMSALQSS